MLLVIKEKFDCVYEVFLSVKSCFMATSMETRLNNSFPRKIRSTDVKLWFQHSVIDVGPCLKHFLIRLRSQTVKIRLSLHICLKACRTVMQSYHGVLSVIFNLLVLAPFVE